jgi:hypothetical protein
MPVQVTTSGINRAIGAVLLLIGLAMMCGASYWVHLIHLDEYIFRRAAAEGQVIENRYVRSRSSGGYLAVVRFTDGSGQMVTHEDWVSMNPATFRVGEHVTVYYDPRNPRNAVIDRGPFNFLIPGVCFGMGALVILGSVHRMRTGTP